LCISKVHHSVQTDVPHSIFIFLCLEHRPLPKILLAFSEIISHWLIIFIQNMMKIREAETFHRKSIYYSSYYYIERFDRGCQLTSSARKIMLYFPKPSDCNRPVTVRGFSTCKNPLDRDISWVHDHKWNTTINVDNFKNINQLLWK
jgi:hypothetical protein